MQCIPPHRHHQVTVVVKNEDQKVLGVLEVQEEGEKKGIKHIRIVLLKLNYNGFIFIILLLSQRVIILPIIQL